MFELALMHNFDKWSCSGVIHPMRKGKVTSLKTCIAAVFIPMATI